MFQQSWGAIPDPTSCNSQTLQLTRAARLSQTVSAFVGEPAPKLTMGEPPPLPIYPVVT